ncbi:GH92 family glycosyl hydrolase [Pedobacter sp. ASV1-7]|uniref:GH92 family glycosyl hydrolase n=1 Tax=Pedobacter sp. ASV1-7 TaxID=3145237 RepID=UPI0032E8EB30
MKKARYILVIILVIFCTQFLIAQTSITSYVNPFIGTGSVDSSSLAGNNFPGATVPFGFVQLSPDTDPSPSYNLASGYNYGDNTIVGFSHTHLSGTGVADFFDLLVMPISGDVKWTPGNGSEKRSGYRSAFSKKDEFAKPGYYRVLLQDYNVNAELTATEHAGFHRYTFRENQPAHILFDLSHSIDKKREKWPVDIIGSQLRVIDQYTIEGYRIITGWARLRKLYFHVKFSKPIINHQMARGNKVFEKLPIINGFNAYKAKGDISIRAVFDFDVKPGEQVLLKVGLSSVSVANAKENLEKEINDWDFDAVTAKADALWEKELSTVQIEATPEVKTIFYTGLYHLFIQPNVTSDINGDYQASDMTIKTAPTKKHYSTFSLWDTYRAAHPLYTLLKPSKDAAFINSMIAHYESYGYLPIWQLWNDESYTMIGNHAIPVIVDAVQKGITGFDLHKAYEAVKNTSIIEHPGSPFKLLDQYGYFPEDLQTQSVSLGLEVAFNDWCVAQFAKKMGYKDDYDFFIKRSQLIKNIYDKKTGFFRGKDKNGNWLEPFDPFKYGGNGGSPYTEANAWQYLWYVPQDIPWMIELFGGKDKFIKKLDDFFSLKQGEDQKNHNASGFIGQYAHGNEPSHHIAYLYNTVDQGWKTQKMVTEIMNKFYTTEPAGYSGNEDCGQMSAWYIFSALGFYPVNPAIGNYQFGSPKLNKAVINLENGKQFSILTKNFSEQNVFVHSIRLNGKLVKETFISHDDILKGGVLEFEMGKSPKNKFQNE